MELVYAHTVEGVYYRTLATRMTPALKAALVPLGIDLGAAPKDVKREDWAQAIALTVQHLWGTVPADEGYYAFGKAMIDGYRETMLGKAMFATLRLLGPARLARRAGSVLRNGNNYLQVKVTEHAPNHFEMWASECNGNPHYVRAVADGAIGGAGAKNLVSRVTQFDGHALTCVFTWE